MVSRAFRRGEPWRLPLAIAGAGIALLAFGVGALATNSEPAPSATLQPPDFVPGPEGPKPPTLSAAQVAQAEGIVAASPIKLISSSAVTELYPWGTTEGRIMGAVAELRLQEPVTGVVDLPAVGEVPASLTPTGRPIPTRATFTFQLTKVVELRASVDFSVGAVVDVVPVTDQSSAATVLRIDSKSPVEYEAAYRRWLVSVGVKPEAIP